MRKRIKPKLTFSTNQRFKNRYNGNIETLVIKSKSDIAREKLEKLFNLQLN